MILSKNTDNKLGARPIARIVEKEIKKPVANYLIQDKAKRGDTIQAKMTTKALN